MLDKEFESLFENLHTKKFQQGNILIYQGEVPRYTFIVKSGVIKIYNITTQGDERIVAFKLPGDIFPTSWSIDSASSAFYYYEAQSDGEMYIINKNDLSNYLRSNPSALYSLTNNYLGKYAGSLMRITALEQPKATDKVLYTLYYLLQCYGSEVRTGVYKIKIQLTQQMIADLIGLTRETTAAELVKLKKRSILNYKGREYTINRDKLIQMIGEDNFKDLTL